MSRVFARLHLWAPAIIVLSRVQPLSLLNEETRLRFSYACILARSNRQARGAFAHMLRRNVRSSPVDDLWLAYTAWCFDELRLARLIYRAVVLRNPQPELAEIALRETAFAGAVRDGRLRYEIAAAVDRLVPEGITADRGSMLVVVPVSGRYLELFGLWKRQLDRHAQAKLLVLAMDDAACKALRGQGVAYLDLSSWFGFNGDGRVEDYSKRHLWVLRVFVLRELLARGCRVLSLDLDAVLVGDLDPLLEALPPADIIAQKDYSIPIDVARHHGFIVCCGFLLFRPSKAVDDFLDRYVKATICELDDQTSINHLLQESGVRNLRKEPEWIRFRSQGIAWVLPATASISREIGSGKVVRHFQQNTPLAIDDLARRLGIG